MVDLSVSDRQNTARNGIVRGSSIYLPLFAKRRLSNPICNQKTVDFMCSSKFFLKKNLVY